MFVYLIFDARFDNKLAINLALSTNCSLNIFLTFSPFFSILVVSFSIGNEKVIYILVFSLKQ